MTTNNSLQVHKFEGGGGVVHKIAFRGNRMSAWFDAGGKVVNVEVHNSAFRRVRHGKEAIEHASRFAWALR
jgi:hypothetical protein